jgi:regulator of RNase E activity RraA
MNPEPLTAAELDELRAIPTPAVANAIESFNLRPRTEGFMGPQVRQFFPSLGPIIGYAVTARTLATHEPGRAGPASRADYWRYIEASGPGPRIAVVQDLDDPPALGAFFGEVNSNIHRALGCVGAITNSGIRDLAEVEELGFPFWAGSTIVSHAYIQLVDFGRPVRLAGLVVRPGDLLLADLHGVIQIPLEIARDVPEAARQVEQRERVIINYCQAPGFSAAGLADLMARL